MPICPRCDENVVECTDYQQGRRVVRLCPVCVHEVEEDGGVLCPASRAWSVDDLPAPSWTMPTWARWVALLVLLGFAALMYY